MSRLEEHKEALKAAVSEYVNTESTSITPCAFSVLTGFIDYTFELENELKRQKEEIRQLQERNTAKQPEPPRQAAGISRSERRFIV